MAPSATAPDEQRARLRSGVSLAHCAKTTGGLSEATRLRHTPRLAPLIVVKRLTLDMTAIRDATYDDRERHGDALRLLELAECGEVEVGVPPQGSLADLRGQFGGELAGRVQGLLARPGVVGLAQVARLSEVTFPGDNLLPGAHVDGFHEAWDAIAGDWNGPGKRPGDFDRWYVESHLLGGRDVLLTDDLALRTMCDRLRNEHGFSVHAESLSSYVARWGLSGD